MSVLKRRLKVLEIPVSPDAPCCRCVLRLQHGNAYLDHIWRYGRDRLRVAVGNLLPHDDQGVLYGVCRLTPRHVYILACALEGTSKETLEEAAQRDIQTLIHSLSQYLDLETELKEITPVPSLAALTAPADSPDSPQP